MVRACTRLKKWSVPTWDEAANDRATEVLVADTSLLAFYRDMNLPERTF